MASPQTIREVSSDLRSSHAWPIFQALWGSTSPGTGKRQHCMSAHVPRNSRSYIPLLLIQASIEKTLSGMDRLGLRGETSGVYFGQLLGMADHLTLSLGSAGYKAYKCK